MRWYRFFGTALVVALLACALAGPTTPARAQPQSWARVADLPPTATINDVFMLGVETAWAAGQDGEAGAIYRLSLSPGGWQVSRDAVLAAPLRAIVALSDGDVWAAGDGGLFHRSAAGWQSVALPLEARLHALQLLGDGSEGWASGSSAPDASGQTRQVVLHFQDGRWQVDSAFDRAGEIRSLHFASSASGWAVGSDPNSRQGIWRYRKGRWSAEDDQVACDVGCLRGLAVVRAIDDQTAWAAGSSIGLCAICISTHDYLIRREGGEWRDGLPYAAVAPLYPNDRLPPSMGLSGLAFYGRDDGLAVGSRVATGPEDGAPGDHPQVLRYHAGAWSIEALPQASGRLNAVGMADAGHALAAGSNGLLLSYGYPPTAPAPATAPIADPRDPAVDYFEATGHTLRGRFRAYWGAYGGLAQFGYPLTEEIVERSATDGQEYLVQYFERARFELHPENRRPYDVLLGLLGRVVTAGRAGEPAFMPVPEAGASGVYFLETGHHLAPEFVAYWRAHGGLAIYGYPISEPLRESHDGQSYLVQYFERNRFEYHPENRGTPYEVLLGRLGAQVLRLS